MPAVLEEEMVVPENRTEPRRLLVGTLLVGGALVICGQTCHQKPRSGRMPVTAEASKAVWLVATTVFAGWTRMMGGVRTVRTATLLVTEPKPLLTMRK